MNNRLIRYKSPGAKRLMLEARELKDNTEDYCAQPIDDNLFEWHFTLRGPPETAFDGGYYHGRLSFPTEYPMKPPSIILLTPNGRFETNRKICLSISGYHPETWQPSWSVRTALLALIAFMPTKANRAIGSLDFSDTERRKLAIKSRTWRCETCGLIKDLLVHSNNDTSFSGNICSQSMPNQPGTSRVSQSTSELDTVDHSDPGDIINGRNSSSSTSSIISTSSSSISNTSTPEQDDLFEVEELQSDSNIINSHCDQVKKIQQQPTLETPTSSGVTLLSHEENQLEQNSNYQPLRSTQSQAQSLATHNTVDNQRTYPPLVLKSIFILLILLIVRRIIMMIQS